MSKCTFFLLTLALLLLPLASAKSYTLPRAFITIDIAENGLVSVSERLNVRFSGDFTYGYRDIALQGSERITEYHVYDSSGTELRSIDSDTGGSFRITWYFSAKDEERQFLINYSISKAITRYSDVSDFYWQVWGSQWDSPLNEIEGIIRLPGSVNSPEEVLTYGHPEINGRVGMQGLDTIVFQAFDLPAHSFLELRVVYPSALANSSDNSNYLAVNSPGLASIIESEEKGLTPVENQGGIGTNPFFGLFFFGPILFLLIAGIASPIFMAILFLIFYYLGGREPKVPNAPVYEREIPYGYSPSIVHLLLDMGVKKPDSDDFVADFLNLCYKGYFKLREIPKAKVIGLFGSAVDYEVIAAKGNAREAVHPSESILQAMVLRQIPPGVASAPFSQISGGMTSDHVRVQREFSSWQKAVEDEAKDLGLFDRSYAAPYLIISIAMCFMGFLLLPLLLGGITGILLVIFFRNALPKRTVKGAVHAARWQALQRFLKDNSRLSQVPPAAIEMWEQYLVYAMPLGAASNVQKMMKLKLGDIQRRDSHIFAGTVSYAAFSTGGFSSLSSSFSHTVATSSRTGGSSGFHGGGGGFG